jgi:hypothetical protein
LSKGLLSKTAQERPKTAEAIITDSVRQIWALSGVPDKETTDRYCRHFRSSLRPRRKRGPEKNTVEAARQYLSGKNWAEICDAILPDTVRVRDRKLSAPERQRLRTKRENLLTNAKSYIRKTCKVPKNQNLTEWRDLRLKSAPEPNAM